MTRAAPTGPSAPLRGDEGELFARHHVTLLRAVRRAVRAPEALIEDACATAWTILLRRQPDRGRTLFAWLRTVAVHEAYRLSAQQRATDSLEDLASRDGDGLDSALGDEPTLDQTLEARRALRAVSALPARERDTLTLLVAGYRYREIQRVRGMTYTNVNRQLVKARRRLRDLDAAA